MGIEQATKINESLLWTNSMGIQASKHNYTSLHVHGGWNWTTSASACRFGLLRYLGASAEYSASGSRRERWWGNPVLDGAVGRRKSDRNRSWSFQIFQKPERIRKDPMFLLISDDIWWYWFALKCEYPNIIQTCSNYLHHWTQSFNKWRLGRLGKSWDLKKQCPATRMHTFPRAKPLLFLSQFQDEIKATIPPKGHGFLILETAFKFELWQDPVHFKFDFMVMNRPFPWNPTAERKGVATTRRSHGCSDP